MVFPFICLSDLTVSHSCTKILTLLCKTTVKYGTSHVLVLADFPKSTRTTDLEKLLEKHKDQVAIRWVNDEVALAVFRTPSEGNFVLLSPPLHFLWSLSYLAINAGWMIPSIPLLSIFYSNVIYLNYPLERCFKLWVLPYFFWSRENLRPQIPFSISP